MEEELKQARTALAQQIRGKGLKDFAAKLDKMSERIVGEFGAGLQQRDFRAKLLGAPPPPDTLGGVYGTRGDLIWVDDLAEVEDDAKYAGKVKIVDPDKYAGIGRRITPAVQPPPKLNGAWFGDYSQSIVPPPPPKPPAPDPTAVEKVAAVAAVDHEYEQFKVWLYQMIAKAQDDLSPAFVHSVAKIKFQPLRLAVMKVVKLNALFMMASNRKERLVEFQKWVDGIKPDEQWQVTGKDLLTRMVRVIDPYAT